jgi:hypothetical protein
MTTPDISQSELADPAPADQLIPVPAAARTAAGRSMSGLSADAPLVAGRPDDQVHDGPRRRGISFRGGPRETFHGGTHVRNLTDPAVL